MTLLRPDYHATEGLEPDNCFNEVSLWSLPADRLLSLPPPSPILPSAMSRGKQSHNRHLVIPPINSSLESSFLLQITSKAIPAQLVLIGQAPRYRSPIHRSNFTEYRHCCYHPKLTFKRTTAVAPWACRATRAIGKTGGGKAGSGIAFYTSGRGYRSLLSA